MYMDLKFQLLLGYRISSFIRSDYNIILRRRRRDEVYVHGQ